MIRSYKNKVTQAEIIQAAQNLVQQGHTPTIAKVRQLLAGRGSESTILKYLTRWKQQCFKQINDPADPHQPDHQILEEQRKLEQTLNKQFAQNENYARELINAEKTIVKLKEEVYNLQVASQATQTELEKAIAVNTNLQEWYKKLQTALDLNRDQMIKQQQQTIDDLRTEVQMINEQSIAALRETSTQGHELVMQEKVQAINLQAKIDDLTKELLESKKQLNGSNMKAQFESQALLRQINRQQQIMRQHIGVEKLQQLEQEELGLNFNNKIEAPYGK
jgi:hypothetical protein